MPYCSSEQSSFVIITDFNSNHIGTFSASKFITQWTTVAAAHK
jgi:hypothetical protein